MIRSHIAVLGSVVLSDSREREGGSGPMNGLVKQQHAEGRESNAVAQKSIRCVCVCVCCARLELGNGVAARR